IPKSVTVEFDLGSELPLLEADAAQLQQIVMNLMINGAEACEDAPGTVTIRTARVQRFSPTTGVMYDDRKGSGAEYVAISVMDTGSGMEPETLQRIFEPFFSTKFTGRGLGLAAIRGIIRAHRGAIHVDSKVGRGTTFTALLPASLKRAQDSVPAAPQFGIPAGATILVIDDEAEVRNVVQAVLESRGATVLVAEDGIRGVDLFKRRAKEIDAVLLDLTMPGMGGEDVYREISALRPDTRVIVSSGYSESETTEKFHNAPLAGFVHKPYTAETLITKIGAALSHNPA
ncbi:MAG: ATP-binding protein, partial [Phycisphaerae bacterium]